MIFVDGPTEYMEGKKGICLDLLRTIEQQGRDYPCFVIVDGKRNSFDYYQHYFKRGQYDPILDIGRLEFP